MARAAQWLLMPVLQSGAIEPLESLNCWGRDPNHVMQDFCCLHGGLESCFAESFTFEACCEGSDERWSPLTDALVEHLRSRVESGDSRLPSRWELFASLLASLNLSRAWAEVGVQGGSFIQKLLANAPWPLVQTLSQVSLIDTWRHHPTGYFQDKANVPDEHHQALMQEAMQRLTPYWPKVRFLQVESVVGARVFDDESLDFV
ncbi:unnamed protein product, partial [Symbiodinium natans]